MKTLTYSKLIFPILVFAIVGVAAYAQGQLTIQKLSNIEKLSGQKSEIQLPEATLEPVELVFDSNEYIPELRNRHRFEFRMKETVAGKKAVTDLKKLDDESFFEDEIKIEEWMLHPFNSVNTKDESVEVEEDIQLEPWMTDLSYWNI